MTNQKYDIVTVLNHDYMPFGALFMNSIFDMVDFKNISNIFVFDTGLEEEDRVLLSIFPKVKVVATDMKTSHKEMHDDEWCRNVYSKTTFLAKTIETYKNPAIMIDSDSIFLSDFFDLVDPSYDFQACLRSNQREGFSSHIGSFFVVNNIEKAAEFLDDWVKEIESGSEKHKESPALSRLVKSEKYNVGDVPEKLVSYFSYEYAPPSEEVRIMHLKSDFGRETVRKRIEQPFVKDIASRYFR